jgi:hypothetical protein
LNALACASVSIEDQQFFNNGERSTVVPAATVSFQLKCTQDLVSDRFGGGMGAAGLLEIVH